MQKRSQREREKLSDSDKLRLAGLNEKKPAFLEAFWFENNQLSLSGEIWNFFQNKISHTKYTQYRRQVRRLKNLAQHINETWSFDLPYVENLLEYNNGVKHFLVLLSFWCTITKMQSSANSKPGFGGNC